MKQLIQRALDYDCVLESNEDTPIRMRRDKMIMVNGKKLMGTQRFSFQRAS